MKTSICWSISSFMHQKRNYKLSPDRHRCKDYWCSYSIMTRGFFRSCEYPVDVMILLVHIISMSCLVRLRQKSTSIFQNSNYGAAICLRCCPDGSVTVHFSVYVAGYELDVDIISGIWSQTNDVRFKFAFWFLCSLNSMQKYIAAKNYSSERWAGRLWFIFNHSGKFCFKVGIIEWTCFTFLFHCEELWHSCRNIVYCMPVFKAEMIK